MAHMNFLEKLNKLMIQQGLNKSTLSKACNIPYTTIDGWYKKGYEGLKLTTLRKLSDFFGVSLDFWVSTDEPSFQEVSLFPNKKSSPITLTGEHKDMIEKYDQLDGFGKSAVRSIIDVEAARMEAQQVQKEQFEDMKQNKIVRLFCYAQPVSAGTGAHLDDEDGDILDVVMNMETARADFCVRVSGHSMEPEYKNGDILLIHAQPDIEEGEDGIFVIDGAGYVKEKGPDCLISKNYNYPDIFPEEGIEIKCLGKVVNILNPYDIVR